MNFKISLSAALMTLATGLAFAGSPPAALAPAHSALSDQTTPRLVVKYRDVAPAEAHVTAAADAAATIEKVLASRARYTMKRVKSMSSGAVVYDLGQEVTLAEAQAAAARIATDPTVEYAAPDVRVHPTAAVEPAISNDKYSYRQWPLFPRSGNVSGANAAGGANFAGAWATSRGANIVVGVIDTGGLASPDLAGQTVPGYDFVSADSTNVFTTAGDGDGRDSDPTDPGNYCAATTSTHGEDSDWHGMRVAALIAALAESTYGISGAAPLSKVMHLRVLGRCGGFMSDVAEALSWAVGVHIAGIPDNTAPIQVANLSLGTTAGTACYPYMQDAVTAALTRNVPVVVAAGNDGASDVGAPANCTGVITVGAHTKSGDMSTYSNHSTLVTLTAPGGGNCISQGSTCLTDGTVTLGNTGLTTAVAFTEGVYFYGTSAATPHVSAAVALIRSMDLTLTPVQIMALLKATAKPHAADSYCAATPYMCGAGMLDAAAAVAAVAAPVASIAPSYSTATTAGNTRVVLTANVSDGLGSTYTWTQTSGPAATLAGANTAAVSFTTPPTSVPMAFQVAVVTSVNTGTTAAFTVTVANKPTLAVKAYAAAVGIAGNTVLEGSDVDGDVISYSMVSGPAGMTMTGNTVSWTPTTAGTFTADFSLTDATGQVDSETVTFTVAAAGPTGGTGGTTTSSGGGAGSTDMLFLGLLGLALFTMTRKSR